MKQHRIITIFLLLSISSFSPAQNWVQQHPNHNLSALKDICFNDLGQGIAVGDGKAILTSSDWGETWTEQGFLPLNSVFYKVEFAPVPGSTVAYLLDNTRVFKTTDAGLNWTKLNLVVGLLGSTKVLEVLSEDEAFVLGASNILHTIDGGLTWTIIDKPTPAISIKSFQFLNPQLGWVGGTNGDIFGTTNGGATWTALDTSQFDKPVSLRFIDANIGYAGIDKALAKTIDGGETWTVLNATAFSTNINDIAFVNATNVFFTQGNRVVFTNDGGTTVGYRQPFGYSGSNNFLFTLPDGRIWVVSDYHSIGFSSDNGEAYTEQIPGNKNYLSYIKMLDEDHGWATGFNFSILKTADGGDTWEDVSPVPTPTSTKNVRNGYAFSKDEFWVCGGNFITKTTDGGATWNSISQGPGAINELEATSSAVYAAHTNGRVYKTTNGGISWTFAEVQAQSTLVALSFPTENVGYVVGWAGLMAKTTDGGLNWTVLDFPSTDNIGEVFFLDENTGWAALDRFSTTMYHTTDGGQNWVPITLPSSAFWYNILFLNAQEGFLSGGSSGSGRMIRTIDGGLTWNQLYGDEQITRGLSMVETANSYLMWLCGSGGSIFHMPIQLSSVFEQMNAESLELSPNPARGMAKISKSEQFSKAAILDVIDMQGRVVSQRSGIPAFISLETFSSGLYLVRIRDNAKIYLGKLAVE